MYHYMQQVKFYAYLLYQRVVISYAIKMIYAYILLNSYAY